VFTDFGHGRAVHGSAGLSVAGPSQARKACRPALGLGPAIVTKRGESVGPPWLGVRVIHRCGVQRAFCDLNLLVDVGPLAAVRDLAGAGRFTAVRSLRSLAGVVPEAPATGDLGAAPTFDWW